MLNLLLRRPLMLLSAYVFSHGWLNGSLAGASWRVAQLSVRCLMAVSVVLHIRQTPRTTRRDRQRARDGGQGAHGARLEEEGRAAETGKASGPPQMFSRVCDTFSLWTLVRTLGR